MKNKLLFILLLAVMVLSGCGEGEAWSGAEETLKEHEDTAAQVDIEKYENGSFQPAEDIVLEKYHGEPAHTYDVVYTLDEVLALAIDSISSKDEMIPLLDQLDEHHITATFFASPEQLDMYPEGAEEIIERGHTIENHASYGMDLDVFEYDEIYQRMEMTNEKIERATGDTAEYVFIKNNDNKNLNAVAAELDMTGVVKPVSELKLSDDEEKLKDNIKKSIARGGVLSMNAEDSSLIPYLKEAAKEVDFNFVALDHLISADEGRKNFLKIDGADAIQMNSDLTEVQPNLHYQQPTADKEVALTFDDWASEAVVLEVLDILDRYDIQSTFYLKSEKIQENPNLARLLIERGHEVANHTHSHPDTTTLTAEELQEDVYHAHKIITEAIQEQPALYFRPPFGRIDDEGSNAIAAMGYEAIGMYDISSYDWNEEYTEQEVIDRVMTNVKPGSVIVMHILDDIHTPSVLDDVIESLQSEGYEFVLTSDWLNG